MDTLRHRIEKNHQLRALYGSTRSSPTGVVVPTIADAMKRSPNTSVGAPAPETMDLVDMLTDAQRQLHYKGLEKAGLPPEQVKRLRNLEKLAGSTGEFIALALEKLSHNYYFQILKLMALADRTWDDLMLKPEDKGYIADAEARAFFNRNYTDMVKEAGRAYDLFLQGAQAMVEMMMKTQGIGGPKGGKKVKPGWVVHEAPKRVTESMPS